jgi:putative membrane protein
MSRTNAEPLALLAVALAALLISGIGPHDRLTWVFEVLPVLIAVPILAASFRRFRLTPLAYRLILLHALVLILGAHYTYARVPPGFWVQDLFEMSRNPYDRFGHLVQGFVPAIITREILLRLTPLERGAWLAVLVLSVCLAISAVYELLEWWAALAVGAAADAFLGTQGDVWDTQWDMALALTGAILALFTLSRVHDRQLRDRSAG